MVTSLSYYRCAIHPFVAVLRLTQQKGARSGAKQNVRVRADLLVINSRSVPINTVFDIEQNTIGNL